MEIPTRPNSRKRTIVVIPTAALIALLLVVSSVFCHGQVWTLPAGTTSVVNSTDAQWLTNTSALIGSPATLSASNAGGNWNKGISGSGIWNIASANNSWTQITGTVNSFTGTLNLSSGVGYYGGSVANYTGAGTTINVSSGALMNYGGGGPPITSPSGIINIAGNGPAWDSATSCAIRTIGASIVNQNVNLTADASIGVHGANDGGSIFTGNFDLAGKTLSFRAGSASAGRDFTISGGISGATGSSLSKLGLGKVILTGISSYPGTTTISSGSILLTGHLGSLAGDNYSHAGIINIDAGGSMELAYTAAGFRQRFTGPLSGAGNIIYNSSTVGSLWLKFSGSNSGFTGNFIKAANSANFTLENTSSDSSSATWTVNSGNFMFGNDNADLNSTTWELGALAGSGGTVGAGYNTTGNYTLEVGGANRNSTYSGVIQNRYNATGSAVLSLAKVGTGTQSLAGANTFSGTTAIAGGTLRLVGLASTTVLPDNLKIMPLGDSITYGSSGNNAGYRSTLYNLLSPVATGFQFVGESTVNPGTLPTTPIDQRYHCGHSSYACNDISNNLDGLDMTVFNLYGGVERNPNGGYWFVGGNGTGRNPIEPDIVLLLCGANDIMRIGMPGLQGRMEALLTKLTTLRPNAKIIFAKVTPISSEASNVNTYNAIVDTLVSNFTSAGKHVSMVDLFTNFPAGGMSGDGLHPNDTGYAWMAGQWRDAINALYPPASSAVSNSIPSTSLVSIATTSTLDVNSTLSTIGAISGAGAITLGTGGQLTINQNTSTTFSGVVSGAGTLIKSGGGTLTLSGTSTHATTTVNAGTLELNGTITSATTVKSLAAITGAGTTSGNFTAESGSTLAPGNGIGTLQAGSTTLAGTYLCQVNAATSDLLAVTGALNLTGSNLTISGAPTASIYTIATYSGALTGTITATVPGYYMDYSTPGQLILRKAGYTLWASQFAANGSVNADSDNDGVPNGVEYFMGANAAGFTSNPAVVNNEITWPKNNTVTDASYVVEYSTDLDQWATTTSGVTDSGTEVKYTVPISLNHNFVRLRVTITP